jgi:hypothetical protein
VSELYRLIHAEKATHPIVLLWRVPKVARSSFYAWCEGEAARRARQDAMAGVAISETYRIVQEVHTTQARHTEVLDQHSALLARQGEILGKILDRLDSIEARLAEK